MSSACTFRQLWGQVLGQTLQRTPRRWTLERAPPMLDLQLGVAREGAPPVLNLQVGKAMEGAPPVRMTLTILRTS
jgi:hypothetical protein